VIDAIVPMAELAPKVIGAGKSVADLWRSAGGIITDAEKNGKVDADEAMGSRRWSNVADRPGLPPPECPSTSRKADSRDSS
jgi:hypothetical protein